MRRAAESGAFSPAHAAAMQTKNIQLPASGTTQRHQRGPLDEPGCHSYSGDTQLDYIFHLELLPNAQRKLSTHVVFQKYFILILIQVQGNKRTRIYLTGHGNETVKVLFC